MDTVVQESAVPAEVRPAPTPGGAHAAPRTTPDLATVRRVWTAVSVPFWIAVSRLGLGLVFAHLVVVLLPQARQHLSNGSLNNGTWLGTFDRWDSIYYMGIAQHGYPLSNMSQTAFFPGYPILIAVMHAVSFGSLTYLQSAMAVSWLAFTAASVVLYRLAARVFGPRVALLATVLFCWFPASLFFMAPYSEALFALEILLVVVLIERQAFLAAAVVAACASATSPESVALTVALVVAAALAGRGMPRTILYAVVSGLGIGGYMVYLWARFGHPFEFLTVQKFWHRAETLPWVGLYRNIDALRHFFVGPGPAPGGTIPTSANIKWMWLLDDGALVLATILMFALVGMWLARARRPGHSGDLPLEERRIPISFVVVTAIIVLLAACTTISPYGLSTFSSSEGEARFVSIAFPLYLSGALLIRRHAALICFAVGGSVILALLFQAMYNLGYWVT